jgi:sulfur carrier protein
MKIKVNGAEQEYTKAEIALIELLQANKVAKPEMVSVQINGNFVNRDSYSQTNVKENDEVDFLYFMGGGQKQIIEGYKFKV